MTSNEIRASFLQHFERNGHRVVPSSPLVPHDDPTLLFTNAGMNQFKDLFLGKERRDYRRATTAQKCMRVSGKHNDLDNVGPSLHHHTFFEMLGNFSFGDYFKKDAIRLAWGLLTEVWRMPPDRLVVSVFKGEGGIPRDDEAYDIWRQYAPGERILELGSDDNFWQMGETGPCGRCSEIYYRLDSSTGAKVEIWNLVFMEFERSADGTLTPLPAPSIDTGMGLERLTAVLQQKDSNYDTDLFRPLLLDIAGMTGQQTYRGSMSPTDISIRVVADHIRAMTFLIADGVLPSNEWRGYVLRKIMRRAMRHGRHVGMNEPFLHKLVGVLVNRMGDAYPELRANRFLIETVILAEEVRFGKVLNDGLPRLEAEIEKALKTSNRVLSGEAAFRLYDTFGLPYEFIEDTAATQDVKVDREGYDRAMEGQREKARAKSAFKGGEEPTWYIEEGDETRDLKDQFEGYESTTVTGVPIVELFNDQPEWTTVLHEGQSGWVVVPKTPFYIEAGGQVSDSGRIVGPTGEATVDALRRIPVRADFPRAHHVRVTKGLLRRGDIVTAEVDVATRDATRRNHTATHLLHAALRQVLGTHVKQAGSLVAPDRLRFDFVHFQGLTRDELNRIERLVNEQIYLNSPVQTDERTPDEAIAAGAMALFGEKYGERVRVVSIPGFSMELCGGTHCRATGDIGLFIIVSESGIAAGVRRIEAVTGEEAVARYQTDHDTLQNVLQALNVPRERALDTVQRLQAEIKRVAKELEALRVNAFDVTGPKDGTDVVEIGDVKLYTRIVPNADKTTLRNLADSLRQKAGSGVVVLASPNDGTVSIVIGVTKNLSNRIHAGQMVKQLAPIVGGSGGGRPDFAEAGGKEPDKIGELFVQAREVVSKMLESPSGPAR